MHEFQHFIKVYGKQQTYSILSPVNTAAWSLLTTAISAFQDNEVNSLK